MSGVPVGDSGGLSDILARVYPQLQRIAAARSGGLVSPSSLVQETVLRVLRLPSPPRTEEAVVGVAIQMMPWGVIDRHRQDAARKRRETAVARDVNGEIGENGHGGAAGGSNGDNAGQGRSPEDDEPLREALLELSESSPRAADVLLLHHACGIGLARVGELLSISERTAQRDLDFARRWLASKLPKPQK
jgi:DNA-directed RNA polymerase specialized sigma24 family protein